MIARRALGALALAAGAVLGALVMYVLAATVLGVFAHHRDFRQSPGGTAVFVISDGVHTDLVVPASALPLLVSGDLALADLGVSAQDDLFVAFGWGDREFYLTTPSWSELRWTTAWRALTGRNATLVHAQATSRPSTSPGVRELRLSPGKLASLARAIDSSFALDSAGHAQRVAGAHYGSHDAFYLARGRYTLFQTCNEWARDVLDAAGVRSPVWSPLPSAIFFQLRQIP